MAELSALRAQRACSQAGEEQNRLDRSSPAQDLAQLPVSSLALVGVVLQVAQSTAVFALQQRPAAIAALDKQPL